MQRESLVSGHKKKLRDAEKGRVAAEEAEKRCIAEKKTRAAKNRAEKERLAAEAERKRVAEEGDGSA